MPSSLSLSELLSVVPVPITVPSLSTYKQMDLLVVSPIGNTLATIVKASGEYH